MITVLLAPYVPATATKLLDALGHPDLTLTAAELGARPGGTQITKLPPLFPKPEQ